MRIGTKHLRIASIIQILLGVGSLLAAYFMIGASDITDIGIDPEKALLVLILTYAGYFFQVLAGIFGLLLSKKKSLFTINSRCIVFYPSVSIFYSCSA